MHDKTLQEKWFDRLLVGALIFLVLVVFYLAYRFDSVLAVMLLISALLAPYVADRIP